MPVDPQIVEQFELMVRARPEVRAFPDSWQGADEDFSHLYRAGSLLMRDTVAEEVAGHVERRLNVRALDPDSAGDQPEVRAFRADGADPPDAYLAEQVIPGLTRLRFAEGELDTASAQPGVLAELDDRVGAGIVRPEAVLHCCGHGCPAREPEAVRPGTSDPFPAPDLGASAGTGRGVLISLVDSGLIRSAAEDHWWMRGVDGDTEATYDPDGMIQFYGGHGTFGAGCARVTAPEATIHVDGSMTVAGVAYETEIVAALANALTRNPDVVVFTFAASTHQELSLLGFDVLYDNVIRHLEGTVFLAPAGNDGVSTVVWPAAYPWVVSVGALGADWRTRAGFSNSGEHVQVYAPGEDLVNAYATGDLICKESPNIGQKRTFEGMASWSGTSFSTPLVAGMIAARMSATGEDGRRAADSLLELARSQAIDGVGPVLLPGRGSTAAQA